MKKIALIVSRGLKNYALDIFSRHHDFDGKISCVIEWDQLFPPYKNKLDAIFKLVKGNLRALLKSLKLKVSSFDTILIIGEEPQAVINMIYRFMLSPYKNRSIFIVKPFCSRNNLDFIMGKDFNSELVKRVPDYQNFNADDMLNPVIPSISTAKKLFRTDDGIEACETENIFVKISNSRLLGCTYNAEYNILDGCINGNRNFANNICLDLISGTNADVIYDEYICPLTRLYSSWSIYHFMCEVLDKIIIAEELGYNGKYMIFRNPYAASLIAMLGINSKRIIWIDESDAGKLFLLKKTFDVEGFTLSSRRGLSRLNKFADDASEKLFDADYPGKILIAEDEKIYDPDFTLILPEKHTPEETMKFFFNADVIISKGSPVMTNIIFMRKGRDIIEKFPHNWGKFLLKDIISSRGLQYHAE